MIANYHTHTYRCGHASGDESDYLRRAMDAGLLTLGFSDHTPYDFYDEGERSQPMRMKMGELQGYADSIRSLAETYRDRIRVFLGVEAEYYPKYFSRTVEKLRDNGVQYMILGQHFLGNEIGEAYCGRPTDDPRILERYVSQSVEALETGKFTYFAHPDLMLYTGDARDYFRQMRRLCRAAKETETPLEINILGIREKRHYPRESFWRIAGEEGNIAILGCDAHSPENVVDTVSEKKAISMAHRCGVPLLDSLELRPI